MIVIIRILGQVGISQKVKETLFRICLRKKYTATLFNDTIETKKLLNKIRNHVAYGAIDEKTLQELIEKRGQPIDKAKKIDSKKVVEQLAKKSLKELNLKPFFRLHPPRKGIDGKKHAGINKGVLGDNKEKINDLIRRML